MRQSRLHFSASQKAQIVRRHISGIEPVSNLADEFGLQPSRIHTWVKQVLDQAERAWERSAPTQSHEPQPGASVPKDATTKIADRCLPVMLRTASADDREWLMCPSGGRNGLVNHPGRRIRIGFLLLCHAQSLSFSFHTTIVSSASRISASLRSLHPKGCRRSKANIALTRFR